MTREERERALRWIFDAHQMTYVRFENHEGRLLDALVKWIPRLVDISQLSDPAIKAHWQPDGPPLNETTLYEALSRLQSLAVVRARRTCSYAYSDRGLIEYGGEMIMFTDPAWQKLSRSSREILTVVWTIKEAMAIYCPHSLGGSSSCPSETGRLKTEYYSTTWLVQAERALAQYVEQDRAFWEEKGIPFQVRNKVTQTFPPCLPPTIAFERQVLHR
jgi:hypothetical protein